MKFAKAICIFIGAATLTVLAACGGGGSDSISTGVAVQSPNQFPEPTPSPSLAPLVSTPPGSTATPPHTSTLNPPSSVNLNSTANPKTNLPPISRTPPSQELEVGEIAFLDGRASADPEGASLTFQWTIVSRPSNSQNTLLDNTKSVASLSPDVPGNYVIHLIVSDGSLTNSTTTTVSALPRMPYVATEIPISEGDVYADALNNRGQIAGYTVTKNSGFFITEGFVTGQNGTKPNRFGSFSEINAGYISKARAINDDGLFGGATQANIGYLINVAFVSDPSLALTRILDPTIGTGTSDVSGINSSGIVTGTLRYGSIQGPYARAFIVKSNGQDFRLIDTLGGKSNYSKAINASGQIIGQSDSPVAGERPFLTGANGVGIREIQLPLNSIGGDANALNDKGEVVGAAFYAGSCFRAFMTGRNGAPAFDLGTLQGDCTSVANGINTLGQVIGMSGNKPFVTGSSGANMKDLSSQVRLPGNLMPTDATAINDLGQIAVNAYDSSQSRLRLFLLTPR